MSRMNDYEMIEHLLVEDSILVVSLAPDDMEDEKGFVASVSFDGRTVKGFSEIDETFMYAIVDLERNLWHINGQDMPEQPEIDHQSLLPSEKTLTYEGQDIIRRALVGYYDECKQLVLEYGDEAQPEQEEMGLIMELLNDLPGADYD